MRNQCQLVTYADRLAGDIPGLASLLTGPLEGLFGGVHVLPFFEPFDGADAGFDPVDHTRVDPRLGTWDDVAALGSRLDVMADVIVNHMSTSSPAFQDFVRLGDDAASAGMFLTFSAVFPDGATEDDLTRIFRPRPGLPFTAVLLEQGIRRLAWTTFTSEQVDLDVTDPGTIAYLQGILHQLASNGVHTVRLDAVGYAVKTAGTSCFMTPATLEFIDTLTTWAHDEGLEVLVEIHAHHQAQLDVAGRVDWVYDFGLPPLVLHALTTARAGPLGRWLELRPRNAVTVLDTHDGIGVRDVGVDVTDPSRAGLLEPDAIDALVEQIHLNSNGASRRATGRAASNLDLYQVNCTYYDALGRDDDRYLLARIIQLFTPGVPQIYYVGLLAGTNDVELVEHTGVGRDINRHYYDLNEVEAALQQPVVQRLCSLIRFRNTHPAFNGDWSLDEANGARLAMSWEHPEGAMQLKVDFSDATYVVTTDDDTGPQTVRW